MAYQTKTVYPTEEVSLAKLIESSWELARESSTADSLSSSGPTKTYYSKRQSGRGGVTFSNGRVFYRFNIQSALPYGAAIMSATFQVKYNAYAGESRIVSHTENSNLNAVEVYNDCLDGSNNMTAISDEYTPTSTSAYTVVDINSTGLDLIKDVAGTEGDNAGILSLAIVTKKDYDDGAPSNTTSYNNTIKSDDSVGSSDDPKVVIKYEHPQPIWFGTNF